MLGHIENNRPRYLLKDDVKLHQMLANTMPYLLKRRDDAPLYHTHRSVDEKRDLRNKRARAARAAAKKAT